MGDEYQDDEDISQTGAGPMAVIASLGNQYTSKEAHDLAKKAYDELTVERSDLLTEEDDISDELKQAAEDAKAELRAARERLLARKFDPTAKWLALAKAAGSPTATGSFGETLGNIAEGQGQVNTLRRKYYEDQDTAATGYNTQISAIDRAIAQAKLDLAKARATNNTALMREAMKTLSRELRPGAGGPGGPKPLSKNGKIAQDQGFTYGTPEFFARVKQLDAIDAKNAAATAGTDAPDTGTPEAQMQLQDQAYKFGVPVAVIDPYRGMSTKSKQAAMQIEQRDVEKRLGDLAQVQSDAATGIAKMNQFLQLNRKVDSGWFAGKFPAWTAAEQTMDSITAETSRKMRSPGEGSTSDFDARQFRTATVSREKKFQANRDVAIAYKIMRKNEIDRISFLQDFAALNGHLRGADAAWREYLEANPIFDPLKPDTFTLNKKRQNYREFFRAQMGDRPAVGPDPDAADLSADDDQPGHFPGEDTPARARGGRVGYAEGGKVSSARRMFQVVMRSRTSGENLKVGPAFQKRSAALRARERFADNNPGTHFFVDTVSSEGRDQFERVAPEAADDAYADGGQVVSDDDVFGVPGEGLPDEPEDDGDEDDRIREALYAASQGLTLGTGDEIQAAMDPEGAEQARADYSEYDSKHPFEKAAAVGAGMLPIAMAAAPGGGILSAILSGATSGAVMGATGNLEDRGAGALKGGAQGALIGPAALIGARYVYNKAGHLIDKLTGRALTAAEEKLVLAANRDNIDLSQVASDLRASDRLRVPQGVQDVAGRRTQALIEKAATRGGPQAEQFLEQQRGVQDKSYSRAEDQINRGLVPSEYFSEFDKLQNQLYTQSKPLYEAAYKKYPGIQSKTIMNIMNTRDGQKAVREAFRLMELEGKPIGKANAAGIVQKPSLEFLDYVKRGFDQIIATEEKGGATTLGRALRTVRNQLKDELDRAAPEYKAAREQYAGDLEVRDALTMGREKIGTMQPEEVRRAIADMSFAEKDAFRSGVSQHLFEALGKPTTDFNAAQRILGSDAMREKLKATFDDPKKWKIFEAAMDREMAMYDRNKKTLSRVEGKKLQALGKEDSLLSNVLDSGMANVPGMGGISPLNRIYNWLRFPMPMSEKTADEILRTIHRGDVPAFEATMRRLAAAQPRLKIRAKRASKIGAIAAILAAGASTQPTPPGDKARMGDEEK